MPFFLVFLFLKLNVEFKNIIFSFNLIANLNDLFPIFFYFLETLLHPSTFQTCPVRLSLKKVQYTRFSYKKLHLVPIWTGKNGFAKFSLTRRYSRKTCVRVVVDYADTVSPYSSNRPSGKELGRQGFFCLFFDCCLTSVILRELVFPTCIAIRNIKKSVPQTAATTFAFSSVFILLLCFLHSTFSSILYPCIPLSLYLHARLDKEKFDWAAILCPSSD